MTSVLVGSDSVQILFLEFFSFFAKIQRNRAFLSCFDKRRGIAGLVNLDGYWPIVNFSHQRHRSHSRLNINFICKYGVNDGKIRLISPPTHTKQWLGVALLARVCSE